MIDFRSIRSWPFFVFQRAQEALIRTALRQSEESHLERAMLDDKLAATDWEATQDELIQQVARESYLQWLCDTNQQHKDNKTVDSICIFFSLMNKNKSFVQMPSSSSSPNSATTSERAASPKNLLPLRLDERKDCEFALPFHYEGDERTNPGAFTDQWINRFTDFIRVHLDLDDDEDAIMRQVLAISQIEYVESLKKQRQSSNSDDPNGPSSSSDTHLL